MKLAVLVRKWQGGWRGSRGKERESGQRGGERESDGTTEQYSEEQRERKRERDRQREGERELRGDLVGSVCLSLSNSGRDVRNMQRREVMIIRTPHRRGPPCALVDGDTPRGAARSAEPVVSDTPARPTRDSWRRQKKSREEKPEKDVSSTDGDWGLIAPRLEPLWRTGGEESAQNSLRLFYGPTSSKWGFLHEGDECWIRWPTEHESVRVCELRWSVSLPLHGCHGPPQTSRRQDAAAQSCVGTDRSGDLLLSHSPYSLPSAQRR